VVVLLDHFDLFVEDFPQFDCFVCTLALSAGAGAEHWAPRAGLAGGRHLALELHPAQQVGEWMARTIRAQQKVRRILPLAPLDPVDLFLNLERL
jgi:hypothetical protein